MIGTKAFYTNQNQQKAICGFFYQNQMSYETFYKNWKPQTIIIYRNKTCNGHFIEINIKVAFNKQNIRNCKTHKKKWLSQKAYFILSKTESTGDISFITFLSKPKVIGKYFY